GSEARYRTARLSFYQGNFTYAKSQADVLKASTSQLIANDALNLSLLVSDNLQNKNDSLALVMYADAEMLQFMNLSDQALKKLDSIAIAFPNNSLSDDVLMAKAKIFIKNAEPTTASSFLKELIANHSTSIWIDDALFTLADLYEKKLDNVEEAKKLYQQLMTDYPGSMFNAEARKRFRNIRGDNLGT
ncbi:MAG: tetratricopeptide repeat protein, partial [Chitinophagaceae bacterium]